MSTTTCDCMTETDPMDPEGPERVLTHSLGCVEHPEYDPEPRTATVDETDKARAAGFAAYDHMPARAPLGDAEFAILLGAPSVGEPRTITLMAAWQAGWDARADEHAARLLAPQLDSADAATDAAFDAWKADHAATMGREPSQTERMVAYGHLLREHRQDD